jgi:hypothetical protein
LANRSDSRRIRIISEADKLTQAHVHVQPARGVSMQPPAPPGVNREHAFQTPLHHDGLHNQDRHRDTDISVNVFYKHSRVKQYLKDSRALRIEVTVEAPA